MTQWKRETREKMEWEHDGRHVTIPEWIYDKLSLADGMFRIEIHEEDKIHSPYFIRMSGPLAKGAFQGTDREATKQLTLNYLKLKFQQALEEIQQLQGER